VRVSVWAPTTACVDWNIHHTTRPCENVAFVGDDGGVVGIADRLLERVQVPDDDCADSYCVRSRIARLAVVKATFLRTAYVFSSSDYRCRSSDHYKLSIRPLLKIVQLSSGSLHARWGYVVYEGSAATGN